MNACQTPEAGLDQPLPWFSESHVLPTCAPAAEPVRALRGRRFHHHHHATKLCTDGTCL